ASGLSMAVPFPRGTFKVDPGSHLRLHTANSDGDEVIECEKARVHRAVLLGLINSLLSRADRTGVQWLCRRGDLGSQRGEAANTHYRSSFENNEGENSR